MRSSGPSVVPSSSGAGTEPPYIAIARRKRLARWSQIPKEWRIPSTSPLYLCVLPAAVEPSGDIRADAEDEHNMSIGLTGGGRGRDVTNIPIECGILTPRELEITSDFDCRELVHQVTMRKFRAEDVAVAFCKRAAIVHQLTNCITEPLFSRAIKRARFLDSHLQRTGRPLGPLHGLPMSIKDSFNIEGVDSSTGMSALCFSPANESAPLVQLLESLGAVIITKTNVPQTMAAIDSVNYVFGRTINPSNSACTAGGSSGGEGVIVAMRGSMIGIGTDMAGSVRLPSVFNGLVGLKCSSGRFPFAGQEEGGEKGLDKVGTQVVAGPMARTLEDAKFLFNEVASRSSHWGVDCVPMESQWANAEFDGSGPDNSFVIGILRTDGHVEPLPPIARLMDEVIAKLRATDPKNGSRSFEIVEISAPSIIKECSGLLYSFASIDGVGRTVDLIEQNQEPVLPWLRGRLRKREPLSIAAVEKMAARKEELKEYMLNEIWYQTDHATGQRKRKIDAIICPIASFPVPPIDRCGGLGFTATFNLLDYAVGTTIVRKMQESDLDLGVPLPEVERKLSRQEQATWALWHESFIDRTVYLGTPLAIQVATLNLEEPRLFNIMEAIQNCLHPNTAEDSSVNTNNRSEVKSRTRGSMDSKL